VLRASHIALRTHRDVNTGLSYLRSSFSPRSCLRFARLQWNTIQSHIDKLDGWQYRALRRMLGFSWHPFVSYADILKLTAELGEPIYPMEIQIREARLRYLGHVERMDKTRLPCIALHGKVSEGSRPKGAPRMNFRRAIKKDMKEFGINLGSWMDLARGRMERRRTRARWPTCLSG
jgi:hypothetical protein